MWVVVAAISGALAVIAGAFGAHGLRTKVSADLVSSWATASQYHLMHSVVLLALALYGASSGASIRWPAALFCAGMGLFCGSIYLLVLTQQRWLGPVTPIGGLLLILAWGSLVTLARR